MTQSKRIPIKLAIALFLITLPFLISSCKEPTSEDPVQFTSSSYEDLVDFFYEWREFHAPEMIDGVPDYSVEAMDKQYKELADWQNQLASFDTARWLIKYQIDKYLVWAEMNGLDFAHRVKKPWSRDPAFYIWFYLYPTDVPEREGPNIFGSIDLPKYTKPITKEDAKEEA